MVKYTNASLIRTLRQISRDKKAPAELRVRCCELLILIDPAITFNSVENLHCASGSTQSGLADINE